MLDPGRLVTDGFASHLVASFAAFFPDAAPEHTAFLGATARRVIARLQQTDALYHNAEHTMMVTLAGIDILRGWRQVAQLAPLDGLHYLLACLLHDIGFVGGACRGDTDRRRVTDEAGGTVEMPLGASDARMQPWHVWRGMMHVREQYAGHPFLDAERLADGIRCTLFPIPDRPDFCDRASEAGLVRAADLIGQLADPRYLSKTKALYHELEECGLLAAAGYRTPADVVTGYPDFFRLRVEPWLGPALEHLGRTPEGRDWIARLHGHIREAERQGAELARPAAAEPVRLQAGGDSAPARAASPFG